jgi:hypothetical protein
MATLVALPERSWWVFNDDNGPCGCCGFMQGYSGDDGLWSCAKGYRWLIVDAPPTVEAPHAAEACPSPGRCPQHRLLTADLVAFLKAQLNGFSWGEIIAADEEAALAALSAEERLAKAQREATARAAAELLAALEAEASRMAAYADLKGIESRCKHAKGKRAEPCIWLYCDEAAPKSEWRRNKEGKLCAPKRAALTGSQCWAWEYVDPKSKQLKKPHTCDCLHPGEAGWRKEWDSDRYFRPGAPPPSRWDGLGGRGAALGGAGGGYAAPKPAAKPAPKPAPKPAAKAGGGFAALGGFDSDSD